MDEKLDSWGVVELFGHNKIAGKLSESTIAGGTFVRVDVPEVNDRPGYTRFFGPSAIYSINPTSEEVAKVFAGRNIGQPINEWDVRQLLPDPTAVESDDDSDGGQEDEIPY